MRDELKNKKILQNECGIINLDSSSGPGSHWTAFEKKGNNITYFDPYGDIQPPIEFKKHYKKYNISYNYTRYQKDNSFNCGHLCLKFLMTKINN